MASDADIVASDVTGLITARSAAIANLVALEQAGPQAWADYSIDGESIQFASAKSKLQESIESYTLSIQMLGGPWLIRSYRG